MNRSCCSKPYQSKHKGDVAALVRSSMNGLQPFESTIEQTTEKMTPSHKTITAAAMTKNRVATLLKNNASVTPLVALRNAI